MVDIFPEFSDTSKVWIYQSSREFTPSETEQIQEYLNQFVKGWASHGNKLYAAGKIIYNRFIVLIADESYAGASGCSLDKSIAFIKAIEKEFKTDLLDRMNVCYKDEAGNIKSSQLQKITASGLTAETIVFNNLIEDKKAFLSQWEIPVKYSWHNSFL
jgi:hypothetical protein